MEWPELIRSVARFGLSEKEAAMYLSLLRRGRSTARELAREARIDRVLGYRMLDGLRTRGLVEVTAERPRRYVAVPATSLFDRALRERRAALDADAAVAIELAAALPTLTRETEGAAPRFQVLTGTTVTYDYLREMMQRAERDVAVTVTARSLRESFSHGMHLWLPRFLRAGGRFRLIVESDPRIRQLLQRFDRVGRRFPKAQVRQRRPQPMRMTVVDGAEAILFLVPESRPAPHEEVAVWTDNPDFVRGQMHYFEMMWEGAGTMEPRSPRRGRRLRASKRVPSNRALA